MTGIFTPSGRRRSNRANSPVGQKRRPNGESSNAGRTRCHARSWAATRLVRWSLPIVTRARGRPACVAVAHLTERRDGVRTLESPLISTYPKELSDGLDLSCRPNPLRDHVLQFRPRRSHNRSQGHGCLRTSEPGAPIRAERCRERCDDSRRLGAGCARRLGRSGRASDCRLPGCSHSGDARLLARERADDETTPADQLPQERLPARWGARSLLRLEPASGLGRPFADGSALRSRIRAYSARSAPVSYTHLRAHETVLDLVCRL